MALNKQSVPRRIMGNKLWFVKAPPALKAKLDAIRIRRIQNGKDKSMTTYTRLLLAASRHKGLIDDLSIADLKKDENGDLQ